MNMLEFYNNILHNIYILCLASGIALIFKLYLWGNICSFYFRAQAHTKNVVLMAVILFSSLWSELYWILFSLKKIEPMLSYLEPAIWTISRLTWTFNPILYLTISLFIDNLLRKTNQNINLLNFLRWGVGIGVGAYFFSLALFAATDKFATYEFTIGKIAYFYAMILGLYTILKTTSVIFTAQIPILLKHQLKFFTWMLITPYLAFELLTANPFAFSSSYVMTNYGFIALSSAFFTYAMYFCARKLIRLRFLNVKDHVEINYNFNFVKDFKKTLNDLGYVSSINELKTVSQQFFATAFNIPYDKINLYLWEDRDPGILNEHRQRLTEQFINDHTANPVLHDFLYQSKIFIKDEIEFSLFYDEQTHYQEAFTFLRHLRIGLFLPIFDKKKLIGYIMVDEEARPKQFYSSAERDEMTVFAAYLSSIINLLRNRNLDALLVQEKELKEELYLKHQEINQYKESIRSFIRTSQERAMGVLFYKNKKFTFANQAAEKLIQCDVNTQQGHPLSQALRQMTTHALQYKTTQTKTYKEADRKLIFTAIPSDEINGIIITVHYPEIADTIRLQADYLKDPTQWDYVLYLETTESGQIVNQLIPGSGETLLAFKINVLKAALSKKATLLSMPTQDLEPIVDCLHAISLRKQLYTITLTEPEKDFFVALKLFGLNQLLSGAHQYEPLLEKLNNQGTLYIENIHLLHPTTQDYLADFLKYGTFKIFKSDHRMASNVRIICSSNSDLAHLTARGLFSNDLYQELKKTSLVMPDLQKLSSQEFQDLSEELAKQTLPTKPLEAILTLTPKDKSGLTEKRSPSLQELRKKIYTLLVQKSHKNNLENVIELHHHHLAPPVDDPEMTHALTLGKEALKDRKTMEFLWRKFQNQTQIATLLGVNRSSVNRRCKKYHFF